MMKTNLWVAAQVQAVLAPHADNMRNTQTIETSIDVVIVRESASLLVGNSLYSGMQTSHVCHPLIPAIAAISIRCYRSLFDDVWVSECFRDYRAKNKVF